MSAPTKDDYNHARAVLDSVAVKAKVDPTFRASLKADPRGTLQAAGLPDGAIDDVLREEAGGDVSGYAVSACWATCFMTI